MTAHIRTRTPQNFFAPYEDEIYGWLTPYPEREAHLNVVNGDFESTDNTILGLHDVRPAGWYVNHLIPHATFPVEDDIAPVLKRELRTRDGGNQYLYLYTKGKRAIPPDKREQSTIYMASEVLQAVSAETVINNPYLEFEMAVEEVETATGIDRTCTPVIALYGVKKESLIPTFALYYDFWGTGRPLYSMKQLRPRPIAEAVVDDGSTKVRLSPWDTKTLGIADAVNSCSDKLGLSWSDLTTPGQQLWDKMAVRVLNFNHVGPVAATEPVPVLGVGFDTFAFVARHQRGKLLAVEEGTLLVGLAAPVLSAPDQGDIFSGTGSVTIEWQPIEFAEGADSEHYRLIFYVWNSPPDEPLAVDEQYFQRVFTYITATESEITYSADLARYWDGQSDQMGVLVEVQGLEVRGDWTRCGDVSQRYFMIEP